MHAGCTHCYAERGSKRNPAIRGVWGDHGTRVVAAEAMWREPLKWNKAAEAAGERRRVFCASLADVFEDWKGRIGDSKGNVLFAGNCLTRPWRDVGNPDTDRPITLDDVRARLFALIDATPWLDWQLVTKRPENVRRMWPARSHGSIEAVAAYWKAMAGSGLDPKGDVVIDEDAYRPNVWIGTSISDQETADKYVPELLKLRDLTPVLFLSIEPLLGRVDLSRWTDPVQCELCGPTPATTWIDVGDNAQERFCNACHEHYPDAASTITGCDRLLDWVVVGGESGPKARPCEVANIRSIVEQCLATNVPPFVKQLGALAQDGLFTMRGHSHPTEPHYMRLRDPKGGDPDEWPEDLRVREFPDAKGGVS